jgi:hypothetical protein
MRVCDQAGVAAALQEAFDRGKTVIGPALEISQDGNETTRDDSTTTLDKAPCRFKSPKK